MRDATVEHLGQDPSGAPAAPDPAHRMDAAWYRDGPAPGSARGHAIMVGHTWHNGTAVFNGLSKVRPGDTATVVTTCGTLTYRALRSQSVSKKSYPYTLAVYVNDFYGAPRLFTTTCSGNWDWLAQTHLDVTVVEWKPVGFRKE